jgi:2,4-dienoyl-CoA reductase-like NADH-dependent reductase (Old Yellow Enzyme family)
MAKSLLWSSFELGNITLKNRIVISPMCQYSATDGVANNWHLVHLGSRAVGGAGLIIQEATAISPDGRITYGDLGIWEDKQIEPLKSIVDFVHDQGGKIGIQLAHAGRKASCEKPWDGGGQIAADHKNGWTTIGPSAMPFGNGKFAPLEMSESDIVDCLDKYRAAAKRALEAGYDVIELHAAHGYLLHQFYSPLSNKRTDRYGGSFENRVRFTLEAVHAIQEVWGSERALMVRISATDWIKGGWAIEDSVRLARLLQSLGVHLVDTSSGGNVITDIPAKPNYQVPFASEIRKQTGMPTGAVGLINTPEQAEAILKAGDADLIFIARESLRNPYFPLYAAHILEGKNVELWPDQYKRAYPDHGEWD